MEPPVGIEPTTFSLRAGTTASHLLSTSASSNTAAPSKREIPHTYPSFGATSHAMHLDHPRSRLTPGRARPGPPGAGLLIRRSLHVLRCHIAEPSRPPYAWLLRARRARSLGSDWGQSALPCRGEPGCYAWLSGVVMSVGFGWPVTVNDRPGPLARSRCGTGVARPSDP